MTWAWTPHSGRTHFAHPPPRVMGTHKTLTKMWPRKHVRTHKFTQIWSSIRTHIWTHVVSHKLRPHVTTRPHDFGHPDISTHSHICPLSPIKFWAPKQRMNSHVSGNIWATTNCYGRSSEILGIHNRPRNWIATCVIGRPRIVGYW